ncbi:MAG TPA: glycosyltransferase family 9 protein [Bryobacteraceae bacterium]|nr:glycosyltransferase family 9 protein [Bryobacteraceae bacterium]
MGSTSNNPHAACGELLALCLRGEPWTNDLLDRAIAEDSGRAFFSVVVERLGDLFEPRLCAVYDRLMSDVIARVAPELMPRLRTSGAERSAPPETADRVYVLSRVTLGADVAVTSVLLDAAKRRYPDAEIVFVGPRKSYELFEADPRVRHVPTSYSRGGSLGDRLRSSAGLWIEDGLVIDPDSRLTQLGLIAVCPADRYFLFPSRSYGGESLEQLPDLAARWAREIFDVGRSRPYIAPREPDLPGAEITVSLGVGENESKRVAGDFERDLLRILMETGASVLVDKGGSPEEAARVERVLPSLNVPPHGGGARTHEGSFGVFASLIRGSRLFVGYDSAGGHVASACGVPLISVAKGFASDRMAARWRPNGFVIDGNDPQLLLKVRSALTLIPGP